MHNFGISGSWIQDPDQNNNILYPRIEEWRPPDAGGTKNHSFYGEGPTNKIDFDIRQEWWDNNIEPPNATGESQLPT